MPGNKRSIENGWVEELYCPHVAKDTSEGAVELKKNIYIYNSLHSNQSSFLYVSTRVLFAFLKHITKFKKAIHYLFASSFVKTLKYLKKKL